MAFDFREAMIEKMVEMDGGYNRTSEFVESMRRYYEKMSDKEIFDEFSSDMYKSGQDSMSYY